METKTPLNTGNYFDEDHSYLVENYPWGFSLKTSRRSWVESKKGHGMRYVAQTMNPKTGKWCKPKKSTYCVVLALFLNEDGHLKYTTLSSGGWSKEETIVKFENKYPLNQFQKDQIRYIRATNVMNEVVSYTITRSEPISLTKVMDGDVVEHAKMIKNEAGQQTKEEKQAILNKALAYGFAKVDGKL